MLTDLTDEQINDLVAKLSECDLRCKNSAECKHRKTLLNLISEFVPKCPVCKQKPEIKTKLIGKIMSYQVLCRGSPLPHFIGSKRPSRAEAVYQWIIWARTREMCDRDPTLNFPGEEKTRERVDALRRKIA